MIWGPISARPISALSGDAGEGLVSVYAASDCYASHPGDEMGSRNFPATIRQGLKFSSSILGSSGIGSMQAGWGEIIIENGDGAYDWLMSGYAVDGYPITIRYGEPGRAYATHDVVLSGIMEAVLAGDSELTVTIRDAGTQLETAVCAATYAGTGGTDGTDDLKGKRRPMAFGRCLNISAPLVIPASLAYQLSDGPVAAVPAAYVRGAALTAGSDYATLDALLAATVPAGSFATCCAAGWARIAFASSSETGQVTWDVRGDANGSYTETTGGIVRRLLSRAGLGTGGVDAAALAALDAAQPAPVGLYIGLDDETTYADACGDLLAGIGGWGGFSRGGAFTAGILTAPAGTPALSVTPADIVDGKIERRALPDGLFPPPWRWRMKYARCWTAQDSDLAGVVTDERRTWLSDGYRLAEASDTGISSEHRLAADPEPVESYFAVRADAEAEARRRLALHRVPRALYAVTVQALLLDIALGDVIALTYPRWDLHAGRLLRVVEIAVDAQAGTTELVGWG